MYYNSAVHKVDNTAIFLSSCYKLKFAKTHSFQIEQNFKKKWGKKSNTLRFRMFSNSIAVGVSCEKKEEDTYSHEIFVSIN